MSMTTQNPTSAPEAGTVSQAPTDTGWSVKHTENAIIFSPAKDKKKKKRRYSRGLRSIQKVDRAMSRATFRVAKAVAKGIGNYRKKSDKSARKKKDGAVRDFLVNSSSGLSRTLETLAPVPRDLARGLNTKFSRRLVRGQISIISRLFLSPFR